MSDLAAKKCIPCEVDTLPLARDEAEKYLSQVSGWELVEDPTSPSLTRLRGASGKGLKIRKQFKSPTYMEGINFVAKIAKLAEAESHHPDLFVGYQRVTVNLTTHAIGGLSENDFIIAAKIDKISST